jgi:hypothetical protein
VCRAASRAGPVFSDYGRRTRPATLRAGKTGSRESPDFIGRRFDRIAEGIDRQAGDKLSNGRAAGVRACMPGTPHDGAVAVHDDPDDAAVRDIKTQ